MALGFFVGFLWLPFARAVAGVGDIVILAEDITDLYKWPRELSQWNRIALLLETQNRQQEDFLLRMGHPDQDAARVGGSVSGVADTLSGVLAIQSSEQTLEKARQQDPLRRRSTNLGGAETAVNKSFPLFDRKETRDSTRYEKFELRTAMQERQTQVNTELEKVGSEELSQQKQLLKKLSSAKTQMEVEALHLALTSSVQRLELSRLKAQQVKDEGSLVAERLKLEFERRDEAQREVASRLAEILKARALTSLQAQRDQNL